MVQLKKFLESHRADKSILCTGMVHSLSARVSLCTDVAACAAFYLDSSDSYTNGDDTSTQRSTTILNPAEITKDMNKEIDNVLKADDDTVVVSGFNKRLKAKEIKRLTDNNWLTDEVIDFYMQLVQERSNNNPLYPSIYIFPTYFAPLIMITKKYKDLKDTTGKVDIFSKSLLFIPVHSYNHWTLVVVDFLTMSIIHYNSLHSVNTEIIKRICRYLKNESRSKKKKFQHTKWVAKKKKRIPSQKIGGDCGVFVCQYVEYLSRNAKLDFTQDDIPYLRRQMIYEIINKVLLCTRIT